MKISVVVPVYNTQAYLSRLIKSLKNQSYGNIELVFVNDGSTDNSLQILTKELKDVKNAKIINNEQNLGTLLSRYKGFLQCTGDYVMCVDSDDFIHEKYIENILRYSQKYNCEVVMANYVRVKQVDGKIYMVRPSFTKEQFWDNNQAFASYLTNTNKTIPFILNGKLIKKDVIKQVLKVIAKYEHCLKNVTMGEDALYSSLIYYFTPKVGICLGAIYHYLLRRPGQTTQIVDINGLKKRMDGTYRSLKVLKDFLISNNQYDKYKNEYKFFVNHWDSSFWGEVNKYNFEIERKQLLKTYDLMDVCENIN